MLKFDLVSPKILSVVTHTKKLKTAISSKQAESISLLLLTEFYQVQRSRYCPGSGNIHLLGQEGAHWIDRQLTGD